MSYYLNNDIRHTMAYNPGGIVMVYLLDINDFVTYRFKDDGLFEKGYVEKIKTKVLFNEIDTNSDSDFSETQENGIYKQELKAYVGTLTADKLSDLLKTVNSRFLVGFRTLQNRYYCFGSDGGASVKFSQLSGKEGEGAGYQLTFSKDSVYPLFEIDGKAFNRIKVLGTEDRRIAMTEDFMNAILLSELYGHDWPDPLPDVDPDRYEDLPKNERTVFHRVNLEGFKNVGYFDDHGHGLNPRDYDNWHPEYNDMDGKPNGYYEENGLIAQGTYKVVDCDEISMFAQPLRVHAGDYPYWGDLKSLDIRQSDLDGDEFFGSHICDLREFDNLYGGFYAVGNRQTTAVFEAKKIELYPDRDHVSEKDRISEGWTLLSQPELKQLIGEMPRYHNNLWQDLVDFFFISKEQDRITHGWNGNQFLNAKNISGISLVPAGTVKNLDQQESEKREKFKHHGKFGRCLALINQSGKGEGYIHTAAFNQDDPNFAQGFTLSVVINGQSLAHGGSVYYSRTKTADELGYRLYVDEKTDRVLMIDLDDDQPRLPELPTGLERGIALRYANRMERVVIKSWKKIQEEAKEISKYL